MDHNNKHSRIIIGGIFFLAHTLLAGCDNGQETVSQRGASIDFDEPAVEDVRDIKNVGVMTELQETAPNEYRIAREYPSSVTGVIVKKTDGSQEIIPEEKVKSLMDEPRTEGIHSGIGPALAGGLLGYMMGKSANLNQQYYANDSLYNQSMNNKKLIEERRREDDRGPSFRSYWFGSGRYYSGASRRPVGVGKAVAGKTGFFSRMTSSFSSFMG